MLLRASDAEGALPFTPVEAPLCHLLLIDTSCHSTSGPSPKPPIGVVSPGPWTFFAAMSQLVGEQMKGVSACLFSREASLA